MQINDVTSTSIQREMRQDKKGWREEKNIVIFERGD